MDSSYMLNLNDKLQAVTRMMDVTPKYTTEHQRVWKELIRRVNRMHFQHTGEIIADELTVEALAFNASFAGPAITPSGVERCLRHLAERGHLVIDREDDDVFRCRLFLFTPMELIEKDYETVAQAYVRMSR